MTTVLIICAAVLTLAIVLTLVFLMQTLSQVKRTAREAEILLKNLNQEVSTIGRITGNISAFVERFTSPWVRVGTWFTSIMATVLRNRKTRTEEHVVTEERETVRS